MYSSCLAVCLCVYVYICVQTQAMIHPPIRKPRNVLKDKTKLWEHDMMVYQFSSLIDESQKSVIEQSMREIEDVIRRGNDKCFNFYKREGAYRDRNDYVFITLQGNDVWCRTSNVGMVGGRQKLYLTNDCIYKREIMSLLLVTMGLYHEHQRSDRDQHIQVHMDNVQDVARSSFEKIPSTETDLLGLPYDFHSITHFGPYAFAKDPGRPTITTGVHDVSFGNSSILSFYDVLKVQTLYQCANKGYTMFGGENVNLFQQMSPETYYPQWFDTPKNLPQYMTTGCRKNNSNDVYTLTVLHGATWTSKLPLPAGNFCVSVDICIASCSPDMKSYIQLLEGPDSHNLSYTQPSGHWETLSIRHTSKDDWNVGLKGHILWGGDVLAFDNLVVSMI